MTAMDAALTQIDDWPVGSAAVVVIGRAGSTLRSRGHLPRG